MKIRMGSVVQKCLGIVLSLAMVAGLMVAVGPVNSKAETIDGSGKFIAVYCVDPDGDLSYEKGIKLVDNGTAADVVHTLETEKTLSEGNIIMCPSTIMLVANAKKSGNNAFVYVILKEGSAESKTSLESHSGEGIKSTTIDVKASAYKIDKIDTSPSITTVTLIPYYLEADDPAPSSHTHSWTYGTIYEPTENSDGLEGEYCSCGAQRNTSVIPAIDAVIRNRYQQIDAAKPGVDTILEMKNNCNFSQAFMKKLASKSNCSFILRFTYEKKHYEAYIPAGTTFDTSLEWYGPEMIMKMFEWKQLN